MLRSISSPGGRPEQCATRIASQASVSRWRRRVGEYQRNGYWNEVDWGSRPGRAGCLCPAEIQREFGIEPAKPASVERAA